MILKVFHKLFCYSWKSSLHLILVRWTLLKFHWVTFHMFMGHLILWYEALSLRILKMILLCWMECLILNWLNHLATTKSRLRHILIRRLTCLKVLLAHEHLVELWGAASYILVWERVLFALKHITITQNLFFVFIILKWSGVLFFLSRLVLVPLPSTVRMKFLYVIYVCIWVKTVLLVHFAD